MGWAGSKLAGALGTDPSAGLFNARPRVAQGAEQLPNYRYGLEGSQLPNYGLEQFPQVQNGNPQGIAPGYAPGTAGAYATQPGQVPQPMQRLSPGVYRDQGGNLVRSATGQLPQPQQVQPRMATNFSPNLRPQAATRFTMR
jgi:hypothetical protein